MHDVDHHLVAGQMRRQGAMIAGGANGPWFGLTSRRRPRRPVPPDAWRQSAPGPQVRTAVGPASAVRTGGRTMAREALDQQAQLVVLGIQFAQHLLQQDRVVRQGVRDGLHIAMMNEALASVPELCRTQTEKLSGEFRPAARHWRSPFASVEQRGQLRRRQRDPSRRGRRRPNELAAFEPLGQHAEPDAVMPDQLDQLGTTSTKGVYGTIERVLGQVLLHQHRQAHHSLAHISHATGQIDPQTRRDRDHAPSNTPRTRRSARPSTCASSAHHNPASQDDLYQPVGASPATPMQLDVGGLRRECNQAHQEETGAPAHFNPRKARR